MTSNISFSKEIVHITQLLILGYSKVKCEIRRQKLALEKHRHPMYRCARLPRQERSDVLNHGKVFLTPNSMPFQESWNTIHRNNSSNIPGGSIQGSAHSVSIVRWQPPLALNSFSHNGSRNSSNSQKQKIIKINTPPLSNFPFLLLHINFH